MNGSIRVLSLELRTDNDLVLVRQRAREIGRLLGFGTQDCTRLATAVSEIARNAYRYAAATRVMFAIERGDLVVTVSDKGRGIPHLDSVLDGTYVSGTGLGQGIVGSKRLVDSLDIETSDSGTTAVLRKKLPAAAASEPELLARISVSLGLSASGNAYEELQMQNQELVRALDELRERNIEVGRLNQELEDTNRGVLALYAELDDKAESLKRASELKTRFLSNMSHEFRTPLNSILSMTGLLSMQIDGPLAPEQQRQIDYIRSSALSLIDMVNDLLDIAKIEAGKTDVKLSEFRLDEFFTAIRGMFRPLMVNDAVTLEIDVPAPLVVRSDEAKLSQIVRNFVSNAIKFTKAGRVRIWSEVDGARLTILVSDSGIGIPAHYLDSIFEEFVQVENPLQTHAKGTGLGLPLSRRLAQLLGGDVGVVSRIGEGSTFRVTIPVENQRTAAPARHDLDGGTTARVLIIDDDPASRYILRSTLPAGCDVEEADDGPEGIMKAKKIVPDIVFVDVLMPTMNGIEVVKRLRHDPTTAQVPVVVRTSKTLTPDEHATLASEGVLSVIDKADSIERNMSDMRSIFRKARLLDGE